MKYLLILLFIINYGASAQITIRYLNEKKEIIKNQKKATSYVVIQKLSDTAYFVSEYDKFDTILVKGYYRDSLMKMPHGKFIHYYKHRVDKEYRATYKGDTLNRISKIGYYTDGLKNGPWMHYSSGNKKSELLTFSHGDIDGPYQRYSYKTGAVDYDGNFEKNAREGSWCLLDSNGFVLTEVVYHKNKVIAENILWKHAVVPDSFRKYVYKQLKPYRSLIEGHMLTFMLTVDSNGYITDPGVQDGLELRLTQALNQILLQAPPISPATYNGVTIPDQLQIRLPIDEYH